MALCLGSCCKKKAGKGKKEDDGTQMGAEASKADFFFGNDDVRDGDDKKKPLIENNQTQDSNVNLNSGHDNEKLISTSKPNHQELTQPPTGPQNHVYPQANFDQGVNVQQPMQGVPPRMNMVPQGQNVGGQSQFPALDSLAKNQGVKNANNQQYPYDA